MLFLCILRGPHESLMRISRWSQALRFSSLSHLRWLQYKMTCAPVVLTPPWLRAGLPRPLEA